MPEFLLCVSAKFQITVTFLHKPSIHLDFWRKKNSFSDSTKKKKNNGIYVICSSISPKYECHTKRKENKHSVLFVKILKAEEKSGKQMQLHKQDAESP